MFKLLGFMVVTVIAYIAMSYMGGVLEHVAFSARGINFRWIFLLSPAVGLAVVWMTGK